MDIRDDDEPRSAALPATPLSVISWTLQTGGFASPPFRRVCSFVATIDTSDVKRAQSVADPVHRQMQTLAGRGTRANEHEKTLDQNLIN
jgi:hypothetical protein